MLQDTIEYDRLKNGIERGGIFASFYSLNEKIGYAAGAAILGLGLGLGGYAATTNGQIIVQSAAALRSLYLIKTLVPSVVLAIGALLTLLYTLDDATLARMRERTVAVQ
jgi:Na+/melibiose symporter-like transporter